MSRFFKIFMLTLFLILVWFYLERTASLYLHNSIFTWQFMLKWFWHESGPKLTSTYHGQQKVQTKKWQFYYLMPLLFLFSDLLTLGNILAPVVLSQAKKPYTCTHNPKCQAPWSSPPENTFGNACNCLEIYIIHSFFKGNFKRFTRGFL